MILLECEVYMLTINSKEAKVMKNKLNNYWTKRLIKRIFICIIIGVVLVLIFPYISKYLLIVGIILFFVYEHARYHY